MSIVLTGDQGISAPKYETPEGQAVITDMVTVVANHSAVAPPSYGMSVVIVNAATSTITLPATTGLVGGERVMIRKDNETMGAVNINVNHVDDQRIWGTVQLRLYSDGDYWLLMWTGSRWVLLEGFETGSNANGRYLKLATNNVINTHNAATGVTEATWTYPSGQTASVRNLSIALQTASTTAASPYFRTPSTTSVNYGAYNTSNAYENVGVSLSMEGEWY